ncbi:hypothetical protein [Methylobacterium oryzihabitans]|uniref:Uncharacterized protein n=1 Tax=Methylobacterium oryzihabitans TaxID=2499852 RepID=A0A3S2V8N6_9HYPH|nr:hypothetical protein [Methylobacterium oryzihabitans]RVU18420.1 hypothetical protein EOE48_11040 [Methylobacterium oryzihabitans]
MMGRLVILSIVGLFIGAVSAHAQKLSLPVGEWGRSSNHGLNCSPPFLKIEPNRIVKRLGGGEGRCPMSKIKKEGKYLMVDAKCTYDKSTHEKYLIQGDDDDDSFSLIIQSPTRILFNNTPHELCQNVQGGVR